ncbi:SseB family protein [Streptomyces sodiiphilus]|uniref:SseB family protein n=1 Tax=Streptomyces sodiiphilus TaxID=226217 RepID=A0ABP5B868_9ACTN
MASENPPSKRIPQPAFAGDDGTADPELARALADWSQDPDTEPRLLELLARARLLVPVVAVLGEEETGPDGLRREKSSEMAVLTLTVPGGRRALPVFTCTDALARWRPEARPVAVTAAQALQAAVQEGAGTLVVDLAGPVPYELSGPGVRAVAGGGPPASRPEVAQALRDLLSAQPAVRAARLVPGGTADGTLAVSLDEGADAGAVQQLARAVAGSEVLRSHLVRGLELAVLPPGSEMPGTPLYRR